MLDTVNKPKKRSAQQRKNLHIKNFYKSSAPNKSNETTSDTVLDYLYILHITVQ